MSSALRSPAFVRVLLAGFVSDTGDWMLFVALPLVVYRLTGSALGTSVAFVLELVPVVLLAPVAARLVGRYDRRRVLVVVSLVQAAAVAPLLLVRSAEQIPVLYAVIVLQASCSAVFEPAKDSWMPELVSADRLVSANALIGLAQNVGRLVGGPLGGALLAFGRMDVIVVADITSFVLAAVLLWSAPHDRRRRMKAGGGIGAHAPSAGAAARATGASPTRIGVVSALRQRGLRATYVSAGLAAIAQGLFLVLFVLFVTDSLKGTDAEVGLLRGIQAVGSIAAGAALGLLAVAARPRRIAMIGAVAFGLISLAVWNLPAITTATWPYVVLFMLVGAPGVLLSTGYISLIQTTAANRGSAFAAYGLVSAVGQGVGLLAAGVVQPVTGLLPLLEAQGVLYLLAGVVMLSGHARSRTGAADASAATARKRSAVETGGTHSTS
ncbi:MFS transporter [Humibacter sp.]|uniref:MFS transporter n=1 Tax=Humibacter sp. TaxID=1940291 RepID=UPI003F7D357B